MPFFLCFCDIEAIEPPNQSVERPGIRQSKREAAGISQICTRFIASGQVAIDQLLHLRMSGQRFLGGVVAKNAN